MGPSQEAKAHESRLACELDVFSAEENEQHKSSLNEAMAAVRDVREEKDGYIISFSSKNFLTIAEWISLERRCCHFLSFQIRFLGGDEVFWVALSGPAGTKDFPKTFFDSPRRS